MDLRNIRHFPELSIPKSFLLLWTGHTVDTQQTADRMQRRRNSITHPKPEGGREGGRDCVLQGSRYPKMGGRKAEGEA